MSTHETAPRATLVILAWNAWEHTRACLDSVQPTLRPGDQVVVVDNGSTDATRQGLLGYPWVDVVRNEVNRGFACGCNQGAAAARGDVIVFLNNDTIVHGGWLHELLTPFVDPEVGAVGPRSNNVSGEQLLRSEYPEGDRAAMRAFSEAQRKMCGGRTSESCRLVGFCLAVRAEIFRLVGGFDEGYPVGGFEDDDLCMKLRGAGFRLLIAHGSFVHHAAHVTFDTNGVDWRHHQVENRRRFAEKWGTDHVPPLCLISVCLIVKDEEAMLPSCLESVADLADEIVVYDTGSTDRTIELARGAGANVIEGYWDDSFSRARNAALAHARGEWVVSLDADETLLADPAALRALLSDRRSDVEAYLVAIENLHGAGNARSVHTAIRLFRRTSCSWRHRLHEQVVASDDAGRRLRIGYLSGARIIHRGYAAEVFESKHKAERNLAIAQATLDDDEISRPYALMNYGRALESAGRSAEAIEALREAAATADEPITQRLAVKNLIYILGRLGRFDECLDQVHELRRISVNQIAADIAEGRMRIAMGDAEMGLSLLARVPARGRDDDGMEYAAHMLAAMRGEALASLGHFGPAADVVLEAVRSDGVLEADLGELASWLDRAQRSPGEIGQALDVEDLMPVLGRVLRQAPEVADAVLDGIWQRFPDRLEPLAAAGRLGPRLPVVRALVWSSRLRARGLASACPLVAIARNEELDPQVRILAGAAAFGTFGERAVVHAVHEARRLLDDEARRESTEEISRLAPGLLEADHVDVALSDPVEPSLSPPPARGRPAHLAPRVTPVAEVVRRGGLNVVAPFESTSAHGAVARSLAAELTRHGTSVSTTSYQADGRRGPVAWAHRDPGDHPFDTTLLVLSCDDLANYVLDHGAASFEGRYMIGVWLWDLEMPSEVMRTTARMVHEIWVPTLFTAAAVARATDRRITRTPLPIRGQGPYPRTPTTPGDSPFTFVAQVDYEDGFERQNPLGVVQAFSAAFAPGDGPRLVIETSQGARYPAEHARLVDAAAGRDDISVVSEGRGPAGGSTKGSCLVSLHRSEGTGLALAQAMADGMPTIVTGHSFSAEMQDHRDSMQIPFALVAIPSNEYRSEPGGSWAEPDIDAAAAAMRAVIEEPTLAAGKARRARERARRQFSPSRSVRALHERLAAIDHLRYGDVAPRRARPGQRAAVAGRR